MSVIKSIPKGTSAKIQIFHGSIDINLKWGSGLNRFNRQFTQAQRWLDENVLRDSNKYIPKRNGVLMKSGTNGTTIGRGIVQWITPYARAIYYGLVMVDAATGKGPMHYTDKYGNEFIRFKKGAKLKPSSKKMNISKSENPFAREKWFEAAKEEKKAVWIRNVERIAGGG